MLWPHRCLSGDAHVHLLNGTVVGRMISSSWAFFARRSTPDMPHSDKPSTHLTKGRRVRPVRSCCRCPEDALRASAAKEVGPWSCQSESSWLGLSPWQHKSLKVKYWRAQPRKHPACSAVLPGVTAEPSGFLMRIWVLLRPTAVDRSFARYSSSYCNFSTNHLVR